jgi:hypothetical protein
VHRIAGKRPCCALHPARIACAARSPRAPYALRRAAAQPLLVLEVRSVDAANGDALVRLAAPALARVVVALLAARRVALSASSSCCHRCRRAASVRRQAARAARVVSGKLPRARVCRIAPEHVRAAGVALRAGFVHGGDVELRQRGGAGRRAAGARRGEGGGVCARGARRGGGGGICGGAGQLRGAQRLRQVVQLRQRCVARRCAKAVAAAAAPVVSACCAPVVADAEHRRRLRRRRGGRCRRRSGSSGRRRRGALRAQRAPAGGCVAALGRQAGKQVAEALVDVSAHHCGGQRRIHLRACGAVRACEPRGARLSGVATSRRDAPAAQATSRRRSARTPAAPRSAAARPRATPACVSARRMRQRARSGQREGLDMRALDGSHVRGHRSDAPAARQLWWSTRPARRSATPTRPRRPAGAASPWRCWPRRLLLLRRSKVAALACVRARLACALRAL